MKRHVEKRHGPRVEVPLEAWIYIKDQPPLRAVTKNISRDGMLLDTAHAVVADTRVVDIVFTDIVTASAMRTRGLVIHSSPSGTGVMLRHALPPALFKHPPDARAADAEPAALPMARGLRR